MLMAEYGDDDASIDDLCRLVDDMVSVGMAVLI
jgi:hypothetical protein